MSRQAYLLVPPGLLSLLLCPAFRLTWSAHGEPTGEGVPGADRAGREMVV